MPQAFLDVRDAFLDYVDSAAPGDRLLDAGCGPGHDTDYFVEQGYGAVGVDLVPEMTAHARDTGDGDYAVMDITDIGARDAVFDGVWCNAAVFHVPPDTMRSGVAELSRVLMDGGVMHISYKLMTADMDREALMATGDVEHIQYRVTDAEARVMLTEAGLAVDEDWTEVNTDGDRLFGNYFCRKL